MASDSQAVLGLLGASPPAVVHSTDKLSQGQSPLATRQGLCHSLPTRQAEQTVAGVKFQNSLLPGEAVR